MKRFLVVVLVLGLAMIPAVALTETMPETTPVIEEATPVVAVDEVESVEAPESIEADEQDEEIPVDQIDMSFGPGVSIPDCCADLAKQVLILNEQNNRNLENLTYDLVDALERIDALEQRLDALEASATP